MHSNSNTDPDDSTCSSVSPTTKDLQELMGSTAVERGRRQLSSQLISDAPSDASLPSNEDSKDALEELGRDSIMESKQDQPVTEVAKESSPSQRGASDRSDSPKSDGFYEDKILTEMNAKRSVLVCDDSPPAVPGGLEWDKDEKWLPPGGMSADEYLSQAGDISDIPSSSKDTTSSEPPLKATESLNIVTPTQTKGAGTMGRNKKIAAISLPKYSPLQSAIKSPMAQTPGSAKKVSFISPVKDANKLSSFSTHKKGHRRRRSSMASLLVLKSTITNDRDRDNSVAIGTPKLPVRADGKPWTPTNSSGGSDQFATPDNRATITHPHAAALFAKNVSKVYTTDDDDPFAERENIPSPTTEAVTSAYASVRPGNFQQYLGQQPLVDPFEDTDLTTVQTGGPVGSVGSPSESRSSTPTSEETSQQKRLLNLQLLQNTAANAPLPSPATSRKLMLGGSPCNVTGIGAQFESNFPGIFTSRRLSISPPPLYVIPRTNDQSERQALIEGNAHKMILVQREIEDKRMGFIKSGSEGNYKKWKAAEKELNKLTSLDHQVEDSTANVAGAITKERKGVGVGNVGHSGVDAGGGGSPSEKPKNKQGHGLTNVNAFNTAITSPTTRKHSGEQHRLGGGELQDGGSDEKPRASRADGFST